MAIKKVKLSPRSAAAYKAWETRKQKELLKDQKVTKEPSKVLTMHTPVVSKEVTATIPTPKVKKKKGQKRYNIEPVVKVYLIPKGATHVDVVNGRITFRR